VPFSYDPEFATAFEALAGLVDAEAAAPGDWRALRAAGNAAVATVLAGLPEVTGVQTTDVEIRGCHGAAIAARLYRKAGSERGPAIAYFHGGGMLLGSMDRYDKIPATYVAQTGVPMLSVDYRLAPEHPYPVPTEDCYGGLAWLHAHAGDFGIDPTRIAVLGDSAGGGLAAAAAILARDRGLPLARQILIYPMLDDRTVVPDPELVAFATWSYNDNLTGWGALLGDMRGTEAVPATAAPARLTDFHGLAPAYIEVGELDIFRDEDVEYARRLGLAGVSTELHVYPGLPHSFDVVGSAIRAARRSRTDRVRVIQSV
jgi:acetyl esterase/lipase